MFRYKPDQGVYARGTAFWLAAALAFFGARSLWQFLAFGWATRSMGLIPVLNLPLTPGLIIATLVFVGAMVGIWVLLQKPKLADYLIETEAELKRVTWPSWADTLSSSIVVITTVVVFVVYFAGLDMMLNRIFSWIFSAGASLSG
jgi:preprotein translocase SecE subunit